MVNIVALGVAIFGSVMWFLFISLLLYAKSTPESQVRRRLQEMIENAEESRRINQKITTKKNTEQNQNAKVDIKPFSQRTFSERVVRPLLNRISEYAQGFAPVQVKELFEKYIFLAGKQGIWGVHRLVLMWLISVALGVTAAVFITRQVEYHFLQETMILIMGGVVGAVLPFIRLKAMIRNRQKKIRRQLPEFLDLLCVSVQAGLSFDGAVSKIVTRMKGPLIAEFNRMQNDVSLGMTRRYALTQMARRCDLEEIYLFTSSIIQAEKLGTSMSRTLKLQADNIRERHRQFVKAQALRAPVKIIFPMVLFIFPSIFVVLLFPAVITIIKTLGNP